MPMVEYFSFLALKKLKIIRSHRPYRAAYPFLQAKVASQLTDNLQKPDTLNCRIPMNETRFTAAGTSVSHRCYEK